MTAEVEGGERLLERGLVGPHVDLPEVDVVDPEPLSEASRVVSRLPREVSVTAAAAAPGDAGLGRDDHLVAGHHVADQRADQLLGRAVAVPGGGVDQRAAGLDERDQLVARLVLVGVPAPGHGAEPEPGDLEPGAPRALLHGAELAAPPRGPAARRTRPGRARRP